MASKMKGKVVLITGAAQGIGLCTAEEFARAGAALVITDQDGAALERAAAALRGWGSDVMTFTLDVSDRVAVENMATDVLQRHGCLDVLINNAGVGHQGPLAETTLDTWKRLVDVDFWGPLYHVYAFLPSMRQRGQGHVVNISSGQAFFRLPGWAAYATVKLALGGFSEMLQAELRPHGIAVTTVYPHVVTTIPAATPRGLAARVSGSLWSLYADSPRKVGRRIFHAVRKHKPVERVNVINDVGYYVPPVATTVGRMTTWLSGGGEPR